MPDPGLGDTAIDDSCAHNTNGNIVCDPLTLHCRAPIDGEACQPGTTTTGSSGLCANNYTCVANLNGTAGANGLCARLCTTSSDCLDPSTSCVSAAATLLNAGGTASACVPTTCSNYGQACNAWGTNDGVCEQRVDGTGTAHGLCVHQGTAASGDPCEGNASLGSVCGSGLVCAQTGSADQRTVCQTACLTVANNPQSTCGAGQRCVPLDIPNGASVSGSQGVCLADALDSSGNVLLTGYVGDGGYPAPHLPFTTIPDNSGPTLANPAMVTITFADYTDPTAANRSDLESWANWVVTSPWMAAVGADYNIGFGTNTNVELPTNSPATALDANVRALVKGLILDGGAPAPTANSVYFVYYPSTTQIGNQNEGQACIDYLGYHDEFSMTINGTRTNIPYALIPDCGAEPAISPSQNTEDTAAHELLEAATDPLPNTNPAWVIEDYNNPWSGIGGEVGDLCLFQSYRYDPYELQSIWSNSAALAGGDPCQPTPNEPWFGVSTNSNTGLSVTAGQTVIFTVTGWSTAPTAPFNVAVYNFGSTIDVQPTLSVSELSNGRTGTLTLHIPSTAASQDYAQLFIYAYQTGQTFNYDSEWPVYVYLP